MTDIAGRWLRVSSDGQDERSQEPDVDAWIAARGYAAGPTYRVHGKSAFHGKHEPQLREAMADMAAGKITVLVVWKSDRIDRQEKLGALIKEAESYGGRIEFAAEPELNGLTGIGGRVLTVIKEYINADESRTKSDRVKSKRRLRIDAVRPDGGHGYLWGQCPYGWQIECAEMCGDPVKCDHPRVIVHDDDAAPVIKQIFASYTDGGLSIAQIARTLDAQGVPPATVARPRKGGNAAAGWSPKCVAQVLANTTHAGWREDANGRHVMTGLPPIIDLATWEATQSKLRRLGTRKGAPTTATAYLTGILRCAKCDGPMYRITGYAGTLYRCNGTAKQRSTCKVSADLAAVDAAVDRMVADDIATDSPAALRITRTVAGVSAAQVVAEIDARIKALLPAMQDGDLTAADYAEQVTALAAERAAAVAAGDLPDTEQTVSDGRTLAAHWTGMDATQRRQALLDLGWQIRLTKDAPASFALTISTRQGRQLAPLPDSLPAAA